MNDDCVFCGTAPDRVIFEQASVRAIWDAYPVSPGHALIVPTRHCERWEELSPSERSEMFASIERVRTEIHRKFGIVDAFNVGMNCGWAAGQTIPHVHLHVIPRRPGDVDDPRGGVRNVIPGRAAYWEAE